MCRAHKTAWNTITASAEVTILPGSNIPPHGQCKAWAAVPLPKRTCTSGKRKNALRRKHSAAAIVSIARREPSTSQTASVIGQDTIHLFLT